MNRKEFNDFDFLEKIKVLLEIFDFRVANFDEFQKRAEDNIKPLLDARTNLVERIEKYADDEFLREMLQDNLNLIDKRWEKEIANASSELEHLKRQRPLMEEIIERFQKNTFNKRTLELFFDLFLWREFENWFEMNEQKKEKEGNKNEVREN